MRVKNCQVIVHAKYVDATAEYSLCSHCAYEFHAAVIQDTTDSEFNTHRSLNYTRAELKWASLF
jgi:hypothetical protein